MKKDILTIFGITTALLVAVFGGILIGSQSSNSQEDLMADQHTAPAPADEIIFKSLQDRPAPGFDLISFEGKTVNLSDYKGKRVVLFFSEGAMCQPSCWDQIKSFSQDKYFQKGDIAVLNVVVDDSETWRGVVSKDPDIKNSLVLLDTDKKVSQTYGVLTVASSMHKGEYPGHSYVVLDKDGVIRNVFDDPNMRVNNLEIKEALNKIS